MMKLDVEEDIRNRCGTEKDVSPRLLASLLVAVMYASEIFENIQFVSLIEASDSGVTCCPKTVYQQFTGISAYTYRINKTPFLAMNERARKILICLLVV